MERDSDELMKNHRVEVIKKYRIEECELSQAQMAKVFSVAQGRISDIETGGSISKALARKFAVMTGRSLEFFLG